MEHIEPRTVTIEQVAKMLGIGRSLAYERARRDDLPIPVIKIGRRLVVSRRVLERYLEREKQAAEALPNEAA